MYVMTLKSRKRASKRPTKKTASSSRVKAKAKVKVKVSVRRVHDAAVLKSEPLAPNTSAYKSPARVPLSLNNLDTGARTVGGRS